MAIRKEQYETRPEVENGFDWRRPRGVHRRGPSQGLSLDGEIELVAGAFDIDPKKSKDMGKHLALDPNRVYNTYTE